MSLGAELPLSRRIELARCRRGLSRRALGDLVGRSAEWVRQVERGDRPVDRLSILRQLVTVLKASELAIFLDAPALVREPVPVNSAVRDVLDALYGDPIAVPPDGCAREAPDVGRAWTLWHDSPSPYTDSLARLPELLAAVRAYPDIGVRAHAYRLAATVLGALGEGSAALLAAQRAVTASGDVASLATYADVLVHLGEAGAAEALCRRHADGTGLLELSAARAAVAAHNPRAARAWLDAAAEAARCDPPDGPDPCARFAEVDIRIQGVRAALRLGHLHDAVHLAQRIDAAGIPERGPRSRGYISIASVHARCRNASAVLLALGKAELACPEELRVDGEARGLIGELLGDGDPLIRADVWALAARAGLA